MQIIINGALSEHVENDTYDVRREKQQDADNALVSSGLNDGDVVILTHVSDGEKIQIKG